ncbi:MAG: murein biosynthesis integral membrane protein MurJ [Chloroflexi bacterium]|nr:murein biosynthesis integral membrane protein MurJ [Chloroflexota bacterium]
MTTSGTPAARGERAGIAAAALIIAGGNVAGRVLGVVREQVIAGMFGLSSQSDAFTAASRVPTILYDLLVGGMISAALVPVFSEYLARGEDEEFGQVFRTLLSLVGLVVTGIVLLGAVGARPLMDLLAPQYTAETRDEAAQLLRVMLPALFFLGVSGLLTGYHYARRHFTWPALAAAVYNLGIIVAAPVLVRSLGVTSLAAGVVLGCAFQALAQSRELGELRLGFAWNLHHPGVRRIYRLYLPVAAGLLVSTAGVAIDTYLASHTGEGGMAAMRFATTLVQFPLGLVATAVSFAVLPTLSRYAGAVGEGGDAVAYRSTLGLGLKLVLLTIAPAAVGLVVLRDPVIRLLFERGAFTAADTDRTALAFLAYSPGMIAAAVDQVLIFAFYARKNTVTPVIVGVIAVGVYLAAGLALLGPMGMPGLALANSAQWSVHALLMIALMGRALGGWEGLNMGAFPFKVIVAAMVMGLAVLGFTWKLNSLFMRAGFLPLLGLTLAGVALGAAVYVGMLLLLRTQEVRMFAGMMQARIAAMRGRAAA